MDPTQVTVIAMGRKLTVDRLDIETLHAQSQESPEALARWAYEKGVRAAMKRIYGSPGRRMETALMEGITQDGR